MSRLAEGTQADPRIGADDPGEPAPERSDRGRSTTRGWLVAVLAVFGISRLLYHHAGVRFTYLDYPVTPQLLDPKLLENDLGRSLFYMHGQPPLFNAYFGLVLKSGLDLGTAQAAVYLLIGAGLAVSMFLLMRALRVPAPFAFVVTSIFMVSPATVLYENWMLYTYPVMFLICVSGLFFIWYLQYRRPVFAVLFATSLALLGFTRASFHFFFIVAAIALLFAAAGRVDWRRLVIACTIPLLLIGGLYIKNWIVFGEPFASSWMGMNMANMVFSHSDPGVRARAIKDGLVSKQAGISPFQPIPLYTKKRPDTGVPALDQVLKASGKSNLNNLEYVEISDQYRTDVLKYIRARPVAYLRLVGYGLRVAAVPADDYTFLRHNYVPGVRRMSDLYRVLLVQPKPTSMVMMWLYKDTAYRVPQADQLAWGVVLQYLAAFLVAPVLGFAWLRRRPSADRNRRAALVYLSVVVIWATVVSNTLELGENQRMRVETDPIVCVIATALVAAAWAHFRARSRARSVESLPVGSPTVEG